MILFKTHPFVFLIIFFCSFLSYSQSKIDSISEKSLEEIVELYHKATKENNFSERVISAKAYIIKAKKVKEEIALVVGYRILSVLYKDERVLQYSDSIIQVTKDNSNEHYPALAYEKKGDYYHDKRAFKRALDNYLNFLFFAKKHNRKFETSKARYNIGMLKRRTGNLDEALEIFRKNFSFIKENEKDINHDVTYLNSISALASIFNDQNVPDSAAYYNKYGIKESARLKNEFYFNRFALNQGVTLFYKGDYTTAIDSLEKYIPFYEKHKNQKDLPFAYYYTGEAYLAINNEEKAIEYFKKVDAFFDKTQSLFPIMRHAYVRLDNYYKKKGDFENRTKYLAQSIKVDSILKVDEIYLAEGIVKKYDIPKIKSEKETLLKELREENKRSEIFFKNTIIFLSIFILLLTIGFIIQYRKRKIYRKYFNDIINGDELIHKSSEKNDGEETSKSINIHEEIIENILNGLEIFEKENQFISNEITLNSLARKLQTNPTYLSKVVNHYKENSFSTYLSNLRIDYAINQLKENLTYRKYTVKAISSEVGFNNVQSFTKAFQNSKGINPSYFIKELKKMEE